MKKNVLVQTGERTETRIRTIPAQYNEMGELISESYDETYTVTVPVMEAQNVEMTAEEIAELEAMQAVAPNREQRTEERVTAIEAQITSIKNKVAALTALLAAGRSEL